MEESRRDLPASVREKLDATRPHTRGASALAASLRRAILDGDYQFGDRLPAERDLASHYSLSRGTVREALRQLEEMRLVARRVGSGTYVQFRDQRARQADIARATSPLELIDVRMGLEPHMTRLAVLNASAHDLERMHDVLARLDGTGNDPERFSRFDEAFHLCIAEASGNPLMQWLYEQINAVRRDTLWSSGKDKVLTSERIAAYNAQHRALAQAIEERDVDSAVATIIGHLEKARSDLIGGV